MAAKDGSEVGFGQWAAGWCGRIRGHSVPSCVGFGRPRAPAGRQHRQRWGCPAGCVRSRIRAAEVRGCGGCGGPAGPAGALVPCRHRRVPVPTLLAPRRPPATGEVAAGGRAWVALGHPGEAGAVTQRSVDVLVERTRRSPAGRGGAWCRGRFRRVHRTGLVDRATAAAANCDQLRSMQRSRCASAPRRVDVVSDVDTHHARPVAPLAAPRGSRLHARGPINRQRLRAAR